MKSGLASRPHAAVASKVVAAVGPEDHDDVLQLAWVQATTRHTGLVVCSVVTESDQHAAALEALGARVRALLPADAEVELEVRIGERGEAILASAQAHDAALLVLGAGTQREGVLRRFLSPTLITALTRGAACPVLVTRCTPGTSRILVASDLGDPARPVLRAAAEESARGGGRVHVVHCVAPMPLPQTQQEAESNAATLAAVREELDRAVTEVGLSLDDLHIEAGPASQTILKLAEELAVDLIVLGTHGRSGVSRLLMGSVAEAVVRDATCNVLVIRLGAMPAAS